MTKIRSTEAQQAKIAKTVAEVRGWVGRPGGWIYDEQGRPICHGWASLFRALRHVGAVDAAGRIAWRRLDLMRNHAATLRAAL
jgi:hypothetical protein